VSFTNITDSALLSWTYSPNDFQEVCSFGMHTAQRDPAQHSDLFDWMENFVADVSVTIHCSSVLSRVSYSEWQVGPGFTGYHLVEARDEALGFGSGAPAPYQLALALGYRNTANPEYALGRRRNRFYMGPIKASIIGTDSRLTTTIQGNLSTTFEGQIDDLEAITTSTGLDDYAGISPVSFAESLMFTCNQYSLGRRFDVIRSRAEHVPEAPVYTPV